MKKVSVIIPIYNTGHYLRDCVSSIQSQTYNNLQIILVDDGSQDETASICDDLALTDSRIEVIHKQNEGVSVARNIGLTLSEGEIICFVDSDDTIEPDMIATLVHVIESEDVDIAICDATTICPGRENEQDTLPIFPESCVKWRNEISPAMLSQLAGSAWRCAYRRTDMLNFDKIQFPRGIKFSEDRVFNLMAFGRARKIAYIKRSFYNRLIRKGSACFRFYPDMTAQIVAMRNVLLNELQRYWGNDYVSVYEQQIGGQILYAITNFSASDNGCSFMQQRKLVSELCANSEIRECIVNAGFTDNRSRMLLKNQSFMLVLLGKLINRYHKLCKVGMYQ